MADRLLVEVVRADEVRAGDEVVIIQSRGMVDETMSGSRGDTLIELAMASGRSALLANDSSVVRVVSRVPATQQLATR